MWPFGNDNDRHLKKLRKIADLVVAREEEFKNKTDAELKAYTPAFKKRLEEGETLDDLLPEAFALVREASDRVLNMRPFYVQIVGGITLHQGRIAEMKTGEGKTLTSVMPAYLNALSGKGVHIVEVNEYLAKRNVEWMGKIHRYLGLTVGVGKAHTPPEEKRAAYNCDITYITSSEVGFDYLRDNTCHDASQRMQRGLNFAIVDEVDSILIDESRTPLIMSAPTKQNSDQYRICDKFVRTLKEDDYTIELKERAVRLTESGIAKVERAFNIDNVSSAEHMELNHFILNALKAHHIFEEDVDYIVSPKNEIIIVDQSTGRQMIGRRFSEGLHQAIEAKEGVQIKNEDKTVATITFQNLFKQYKKLSGMTGTAKTEENEFNKIYGVDVVQIPTNRASQRIDAPDVIFTDLNKKAAAILEDVIFRHEEGQPVLIGTTTIEKSEEISKYLKNKKIPHSVLNAKNHEHEAEIVAQAGRVKAVTVATNMAGRGTDILLGGNPDYMAKKEMERLKYTPEEIYSATGFEDTKDEKIIELRKIYKDLYNEFKEKTDEEKQKVIELGGLHIIGTERHDSRRIDNQLRGRSGRQGDPGSTIFYISCQDDIMKRFGKDYIGGVLKWMKEDSVQSKILTNFFQTVQKRVEGFYFDQRKYVFEYDNVLANQRELIYKERNRILDGEDVHAQIVNMYPEIITKIVLSSIDAEKVFYEWDLVKANEILNNEIWGEKVDFFNEKLVENTEPDDIVNLVLQEVLSRYEAKCKEHKEKGILFDRVERDVLLSVVDNKWTEHIDQMVMLRQDVSMQGIGQKDPLIEYRRNAIDMFNTMIEDINFRAAMFLFKVKINIEKAPEGFQRSKQEAPRPVQRQGTYKADKTEIGRNDPCTCGSGKKYKHCCGKE